MKHCDLTDDTHELHPVLRISLSSLQLSEVSVRTLLFQRLV